MFANFRRIENIERKLRAFAVTIVLTLVPDHLLRGTLEHDLERMHGGSIYSRAIGIIFGNTRPFHVSILFPASTSYITSPWCRSGGGRWKILILFHRLLRRRRGSKKRRVVETFFRTPFGFSNTATMIVTMLMTTNVIATIFVILLTHRSLPFLQGSICHNLSLVESTRRGVSLSLSNLVLFGIIAELSGTDPSQTHNTHACTANKCFI